MAFIHSLQRTPKYDELIRLKYRVNLKYRLRDLIRNLRMKGKHVRELYSDLQRILHTMLKNDENIDFAKLHFLLQHDILLELSDSDGDTPLHAALANSNLNLQVVKELIYKGIGIFVRNKRGICPLDVLLMNPSCTVRMIKFLQRFIPINGLSKNRAHTPLQAYMLSQKCKPNIVIELIRQNSGIVANNQLQELVPFIKNYVMYHANCDQVSNKLLGEGRIFTTSCNRNNDLQTIYHNFYPSLKRRYYSNIHRENIELVFKYVVLRYSKKLLNCSYKNEHLRANSFACTDIHCKQRGHLFEFIERCCQECHFMESKFLKKVSLFDLVAGKGKCIENHIVRAIMNGFYSKKCSIYRYECLDILGRLERSKLIRIIKKLPFYSRYEREIQNKKQITKILLVKECTDIIISYLNFDDLLSLTLAYYDPHYF